MDARVLSLVMSEADNAIQDFVRKADEVLHEYERGYMDADAAMNAMELYVDELKAQTDTE